MTRSTHYRKIGEMLKDKKILITGGAGFIGTSLLRALIEDNQITVIDNLHRDSLTHTPLFRHPHLRFVQGDVRDQALIRRHVCCKTHILHLAAIAGVNTVLQNPLLTMDVAIKGALNVFEAALNCPTLERLIDVSTSEVFGRQASGVSEQDDTALGPAGESRWSYAASKLVAEHLSHAMHREHRIPVVVVRPFNVFGPGQVGEGAVHHFVRQAIAGKPLTIYGDGRHVRAWCYIDDFVDGLLKCLVLPGAVGRTFNIGNPDNAVSVNQLASLVIKLSGSRSQILYRKPDCSDVVTRIPDITHAQTVLSFYPQTNIEEGLKNTIDWYNCFDMAAMRRPVAAPVLQNAALETSGGAITKPETIAHVKGAHNYGPH